MYNILYSLFFTQQTMKTEWKLNPVEGCKKKIIKKKRNST